MNLLSCVNDLVNIVFRPAHPTDYLFYDRKKKRKEKKKKKKTKSKKKKISISMHRVDGKMTEKFCSQDHCSKGEIQFVQSEITEWCI